MTASLSDSEPQATQKDVREAKRKASRRPETKSSAAAFLAQVKRCNLRQANATATAAGMPQIAKTHHHLALYFGRFFGSLTRVGGFFTGPCPLQAWHASRWIMPDCCIAQTILATTLGRTRNRSLAFESLLPFFASHKTRSCITAISSGFCRPMRFFVEII